MWRCDTGVYVRISIRAETPLTRMHMNGTIQFDAVFAVRAFEDVLAVPFTWWVIPLLSVENKKSDVVFKRSMMYALDLYALQRRHTCF